MDHTLTINNKKVWDFYNEHKNLNFENMNIVFIDIIDTILRNTNPTLDANVASMLLDNIKSLQNQVNNINDKVEKNHQDIATVFTMKFIDFNQPTMSCSSKDIFIVY